MLASTVKNGKDRLRKGNRRRRDVKWKRSINLEPYLQVRREGVWKSHVAWEGAQDQIPHLDAVWRDDVTETEVVITKEFWEVVE